MDDISESTGSFLLNGVTAYNSLQGQRARRIPDEEWEQWRERLIRYYVVLDMSCKEVVDAMAKEHDFVINELQLKHRLKKWKIKKYINDGDMAIMLSLKRKRAVQGKTTRFQYEGHDIEPERIERAAKRRRAPLLSPKFVPSHIRIHGSPRQNTRPFVQHPFGYTASKDTGSTMEFHTAPLDSSSGRVLDFTSDTQFHFDFSSKMSPMNYCTDRPPGFVQEWEDVTVADAPGMPFVDSIEAEPQNGDVRNPEAGYANNKTGMVELRSRSRNQDPAVPLSRGGSARTSDSDWQAVINWSPGPRSSVGAIVTPAPSGSSISRPSTEFGIGSPQYSVSTLPENWRDTNGQDGFFSLATAVQLQDHDRTIFDSKDSEAVVLALHLFRPHVDALTEFSHPKNYWDPCTKEHFSFHGPASDILFDLVRSRWLELEIESLLQMAYEVSAKAIKERQAARISRKPYARRDRFDNESDENGERPDFETRVADDSQCALISRTRRAARISYRSAGSTIRTQYRVVSQGSINTSESEKLCMLSIDVIPRGKKRRKGTSIQFIKTLEVLRGPHISPHITTFNVVPYGSKIIRCVLRNDLRGVQELFASRKASPRDVNPAGCSLLSYAMYTGFSDMFRLLLQLGTDTQNCNLYKNTVDIVFAIWNLFTDQNSVILRQPILGQPTLGQPIKGPSYFDVENLKSVDQCVAMTKAALDYGCDIHNTLPYNLLYPSPLFVFLSSGFISAHPSHLQKVLDSLIQSGYDLEERNQEDLTVFLFASTMHHAHIINCLEVLVEKGADIHATGSCGRGALHYAVHTPRDLTSWDCQQKYIGPVEELLYDDQWEATYYKTDENNYMMLDPEPGLQERSELVCTHQDKSSLTAQSITELTNFYDYPQNELVQERDSRISWVINHNDRGKGDEQLIIDFIAKRDLETNSNEVTHSLRSEAPSIPRHVLVDEEKPSTISHIFYEGDGDRYVHMIRYPYQVLKLQLRFKLLTLLKAGCDPNVHDKDGKSPSDYARDGGVWPQWSWALLNSGYLFHPDRGLWERRTNAESPPA